MEDGFGFRLKRATNASHRSGASEKMDEIKNLEKNFEEVKISNQFLFFVFSSRGQGSGFEQDDIIKHPRCN